jgi:protein-S-isoprenylcysteine O-methyltransferase Ste14
LPAALLVGAIFWRLLNEETYLGRKLARYDDDRRKVRWRRLPRLC